LNILLPLENLMSDTLQYFYLLFHNYGIAIILLTIAIRLILYPLTHKQTVSMKALQELQPEMKKIQEKHKDNPEKYQQEVMELYKKNKINPLSGCLPLLLQMPVLIALYQTLINTSEFKNAPFIWVKDLSMGSDIPLVLLLGLTTYLSQKMSITDPNQAKMMAFIPILMMFMFWTLPAGVILYIVVSNLFTMAQQYLVMRQPSPAKEGIK